MVTEKLTAFPSNQIHVNAVLKNCARRNNDEIVYIALSKLKLAVQKITELFFYAGHCY